LKKTAKDALCIHGAGALQLNAYKSSKVSTINTRKFDHIDPDKFGYIDPKFQATHFPSSAVGALQLRPLCRTLLAVPGSSLPQFMRLPHALPPVHLCYTNLCCGCLPLHTACPGCFYRDPAGFSLCQLDCFPRLVCGVVSLSLSFSLSFSLSAWFLVSCALCLVSCACVFVVCMRLSVSVTVSCVLCPVSCVWVWVCG